MEKALNLREAERQYLSYDISEEKVDEMCSSFISIKPDLAESVEGRITLSIPFSSDKIPSLVGILGVSTRRSFYSASPSRVVEN